MNQFGMDGTVQEEIANILRFYKAYELHAMEMDGRITLDIYPGMITGYEALKALLTLVRHYAHCSYREGYLTCADFYAVYSKEEKS